MIAREDSSGQKRLVAYVVAAKGSAVLSAPMRRYLGEKLPEYMVPAAVVSISSLPLNPSGKLDRGALPAPEFCSSDKEATNPQEQLLARLFAEVLELDKVGIDERFFDVGGDSLSAIRLVQRARKAGLVLNACDVVQHQSVQALAAIARSGSDHTTIDGDEGLCHHIPLKMTMEHSSGS